MGSDTVKVPLVGTVTAGQPILAVENYESFYALPSAEFHGDGLFLLRVRGESMIEAGIFDGDKVVVRKQESAENGDIVVALFDDGIEEGATVKRFFVRDGKYILHPENASMQDFVLDEVIILGKVIGLLRSFLDRYETSAPSGALMFIDFVSNRFLRVKVSLPFRDRVRLR